MDSTLQGAIIGAVSTLLAAGIGYLGLRKPATPQTTVTVLPDRVAVLNKARDLIESAKRTVIDTTWGDSEENLLPAEQEALDKYLAAKKSAMRNAGIDYREIYTETPDDLHRTERIRAEQSRTERPNKYSAKLLEGITPTFPMVDFLVVDGEKLILSCFSKDVARPDHHHLYIESGEVSSFITQYFQICWDRAHLLAPNQVRT